MIKDPEKTPKKPLTSGPVTPPPSMTSPSPPGVCPISHALVILRTETPLIHQNDLVLKQMYFYAHF